MASWPMFDRVDDQKGPDLSWLVGKANSPSEVCFFCVCHKKRLDCGTGVCVVLQRWLKAQSHCTSLLLCISQLIL